jgi:outer membrane protein assembly factor BamB
MRNPFLSPYCTHRLIVRACLSIVATLTIMSTMLATAREARATFAPSDWPIYRGDTLHSGISSENLAPPLTLQWRFTGGALKDNPSSPVIVGDTVYFTARGTESGGGVLYAIDVETGQQKWRYPAYTDLPDRTYFSTTPTVQDGKVYVGANDRKMHIVDAKTGSDLVNGGLQIRSGISSAPLVLADNLLFGADNGTFYSFDLADYQLNKGWRQNFMSTSSVNSSAILADGNIFFTTADNTLWAVRESTGKSRWSQRVGTAFRPNRLAYGEGVLLIPGGQFLYAYSPGTGAPRWTYECPQEIMSTPIVADNTIYITYKDDRGLGAKMIALNSRNRKPVWAEPITLPYYPTAAPTMAGNVIYIPGLRNLIYAVDRTEGKVLWQYHITPSSNRNQTQPVTETKVSAPLSISNGVLYAVSDDGTLSAFRPDGSDTTGPVVTKMYPTMGTTVSGKPPFLVSATLEDFGSGIDSNSITIRLDQDAVSSMANASSNLLFDTGTRQVFYVRRSTGGIIERPLANGPHTATVSVKDWKGNVTEETWSFVVDNTLEPRPLRVPGLANPAAPATTRPRTTTPRTGTRPATTTKPGGAAGTTNKPQTKGK